MRLRSLAPALLALLTLAFAGCGAASSRGPSPAREAAAPPASSMAAEAPQKTPAPEVAQPTAPAPAPGPAEKSQPPSPAAPLAAEAPSSAPPAPATAAPTPAAPKRFVVFNFDSADVEVVIQAASEIVGFNYVIAPNARGRKVTIQTPARIASDDVFSVLLTVLDVNGLAAVRSGKSNLYRIIPREGAPQTPVRTSVGSEVDPLVPGDEILTQIVPLRYISGTDAVNLLRPFVAQAAALAAQRETNMLIITDTAANVRRLLDVLKLADVQVALEELKILPLKYADAQETAQLLTQIFAAPRRPGTTTVGPTPPTAPVPPVAPGAPAAPRPPAGVEAAVAERPPLIIAERRSNSLIINATKQEMEGIRRLVEQLDVDIYGGQRVFIYFAENVKASDLASTLDAIFGRGTGPAITGSQGAAGPSAPGGARPGAPGYSPPPTGATPFSARTSQTGGAARPPGVGIGVGEEGGTVTGEVRFIADQVTNTIIVTTYPRNWKDILDTIKKLDKMPRQVLIEVLAAEVTLTDDTQLGIEWAIRSGRFDVNFAAPNAGPIGAAGTIPGRPPQSLIPFGGLTAAGLNFFTFGTSEFLTALNALAALNKVNVLSSPSIMTAENKKAVINVSRSVPILTSQQVPIGGTTVTTPNTTSIVGTQSVEYRDAGIILTVTPRIGEEGTVALDVRQEVNDVGAPVPPTNSPEFLKREAETSVVLLNNQTLVLGGLIQDRKTLVRAGIPFLNRIPVLGYLFGSTEEKIEKTELLLLITPRVVGTALDAARLTEQMRKVTPEIQESVQRAPRPPSGAR